MQKLNLFKVQQKLKNNIFTHQDLIANFGAKKRAVEAFLSYNYGNGKLQRLRRGIYSFTGANVDPYLIANTIYTPSYISLETALSYYGLIPEVVYTITSITTKPTREFNFNDINYSYQSIKMVAFTGYVPLDKNNTKILIATPEKALADYYYFQSLGKKIKNDRIDTSKINKKMFKNYLSLYDRPKLLAIYCH